MAKDSQITSATSSTRPIAISVPTTLTPVVEVSHCSERTPHT
jgi:hypothetical protein